MREAYFDIDIFSRFILYDQARTKFRAAQHDQEMRDLELRDKRASVELKELQLREFKRRMGNSDETAAGALLPVAPIHPDHHAATMVKILFFH